MSRFCSWCWTPKQEHRPAETVEVQQVPYDHEAEKLAGDEEPQIGSPTPPPQLRAAKVKEADNEELERFKEIFDAATYVGTKGTDRKYGTPGTYYKLEVDKLWVLNYSHQDLEGELKLFHNQWKRTEEHIMLHSREHAQTKTTTTAPLDKLNELSLKFHRAFTSCPTKANLVATLLHGTMAMHVLGIIQEGVSRRLSGGLFGGGAYFAEDAGKTDQYVTPVNNPSGLDKVDKIEEAKCQKELIKMLYTDCDLSPPDPSEDVFLVVACDVVLGLPLHTKDGAKTMSDPPTKVGVAAGQPLFETNAKRKLKACGRVNYHSLIGERGGELWRFREFVCFTDHATLPRYIVAYRRVKIR